ncbi:MAG: SMP-30/gluconolactonase/LRE family protein [bacterium]
MASSEAQSVTRDEVKLRGGLAILFGILAATGIVASQARAQRLLRVPAAKPTAGDGQRQGDVPAKPGAQGPDAPPVQTNDAGLRYTTTWFGSSWPGGPKWMQTSISYLTALPDGTVLTASGWDEAHRESTLYSKDGEIVAGVSPAKSRVIGGDQRFIYVKAEARIDGKRMQGIGRYHRDAFVDKPSRKGGYSVRWTRPAAFEGGEGRGGNEVYLAEAPVYHWAAHKREQEIEQNPEAADKYRRPPPQIRGIASDGEELFVAEDMSHRIHVLDAATMEVERRFGFRYPGPLVLDDSGQLWVVERPAQSRGTIVGAAWLERGPHRVVQLTAEGEPTGKAIADVRAPSALAFGGPRRRLYVADAHPSRLQVLAYDVSGGAPRRVAALGQEGGVYAGPVPGRMGDDRLDVLSGVGVDAEGHVYVSTRSHGSFIRRYSPEGKLLWQRYTATFMNGASFDPKFDGTVVYAGKGASHRFVLDYGRESGPLDEWVAVTRDPFRFPHDHRHFSGYVQRLPNGRLYMLTHPDNGTMVLRQEEDSEIFVPSLFLAGGQYFGDPGRFPPHNPGKFRFMWRDRNGNGHIEAGEYEKDDLHHNRRRWWIDANGDLWEHHFAHQSRPWQGMVRHGLQGFDEHGNPLYDIRLKSGELFPRPQPFHPTRGHTSVVRFRYEPSTDRMYLFGFPHDLPPGLRNSWSQGSMALRYDGWTRPSRSLVSPMALPYGTPEEEGKKPRPDHVVRAVCVAGELVFAAVTRASQEGQVWVYDSRTGRSLGTLVPGPLLYGETSLVDIPGGIAACRCSDGDYVVCVENNWKNLQIVYRIAPQPLLSPGGQPGGEPQERRPGQ